MTSSRRDPLAKDVDKVPGGQPVPSPSFMPRVHVRARGPPLSFQFVHGHAQRCPKPLPVATVSGARHISVVSR